MDAHEETSFKDSRAVLRKKQLSRYLKPPLNTTWDDSKVADLGIAVDDDLKRTLTKCYQGKSWRSRVPIPKSLIDAAQPAVKKTKREQASDKEEKTDSECTSISVGDSPVASASDQDAIKTGMSFLLPSLKEKSYASRVGLAFCLKAICDADKANHPEERGACLRLSKTFNKLASQLGKRQSGGQQVYLRALTKLHLQQQIRKSKEYPSQIDRFAPNPNKKPDSPKKWLVKKK